MKSSLEHLKRRALIKNWNAFALYGAGKHTLKMLKECEEMRWKPDIVCIADDNPKCESLEGIPVVKPRQLDDFDFDVLVVSSDLFEQEMLRNIRSWDFFGRPVAELHYLSSMKMEACDFLGFNIVGLDGEHFGVGIDVGEINVSTCPGKRISELEKAGRLVVGASLDEAKRGIAKIVEKSHSELFTALKRSRIEKVALYGAGKYTARVIDLVSFLNLDWKIACILDDNPKNRDLNGVPLARPEDSGKYGPDVVIICSDRYEMEMLEKANAWSWLKVPVISMPSKLGLEKLCV